MIIPKISIFHEKSMYIEKIPLENRLEASCLTRRHNVLMTSLAMKRETGEKMMKANHAKKCIPDFFFYKYLFTVEFE